jgi:hypothetical protein
MERKGFLGSERREMKEKDFLARLASLEVKPGEQLSREFQAWNAGATGEERLDWALDLGRYAVALGIPIEQLSQPEAIGDDQLIPLGLYAQSLWRAYALGPEVKERVSNNRSRFLLKLQGLEETEALLEALQAATQGMMSSDEE